MLPLKTKPGGSGRRLRRGADAYVWIYILPGTVITGATGRGASNGPLHKASERVYVQAKARPFSRTRAGGRAISKKTLTNAI